MNFEIIPACEIALAEQAKIMNAAFAGYFGGWTDLNAEMLAKFLCLQGSDIFYSRFIRADREWVGFGYINRTGNILRLSGMGIVPAARGTGAAGKLLDHLFAEMKSRRDEAMTLEVIQQNPRAIALYRRHGFRETAQLFGWRRGGAVAPPTESDETITEVSVQTALDTPGGRNYPSVPWQITRYAVAKVEATRAFCAGNAHVVIGDANAPVIRLHGLFSRPNEWKDLRATLAGVVQQFPNREFFTPAIFPEDFGENIFQPLGFVRETLSQFFMRYDF